MKEYRWWTQEDLDYLESKWGTVSIPAIANALGRTSDAVRLKAHKLGLGAVLSSGDYVTFSQLAKAVTGASSEGTSRGKTESWIKERGLPIHKKRVDKSSFRVVYIDEFWEWAYQYRSFINFAKMEPLILGKEPDWVAEQRKMDERVLDPQREDPWTDEEDSRLKMLVNQQRYTARELSEMMNRSEGAIRKRCSTIGLLARPVPEKHQKWKREELDRIVQYIKDGVPYETMSKELGRSTHSIKSKIAYFYLTSDQDKVRALIGNGNWGDGAPVPTVKKGIYLSRTQTGVKKDLSALAGLLKHRAGKCEVQK